jgi:hypothetical protein
MLVNSLVSVVCWLNILRVCGIGNHQQNHQLTTLSACSAAHPEFVSSQTTACTTPPIAAALEKCHTRSTSFVDLKLIYFGALLFQLELEICREREDYVPELKVKAGTDEEEDNSKKCWQ